MLIACSSYVTWEGSTQRAIDAIDPFTPRKEVSVPGRRDRGGLGPSKENLTFSSHLRDGHSVLDVTANLPLEGGASSTRYT